MNILSSGKGADATNVVAATTQAIRSGTAWLAPVKERARAWFASTQPWRVFLLLLSMPAAGQIVNRVPVSDSLCGVLCCKVASGNYLTAISTVFHCCLHLCLAEEERRFAWRPELWGMRPRPVQRVFTLLAASGICLFLSVGSVVVRATLIVAVFASLHAILHDPDHCSITEDEMDVEAL